VDFLSSGTGVPVDFELVPVDDPQGKYSDSGLQWAEADVGDAAAALRMLRADPAQRLRLGIAAAAHAAEFFCPSHYVHHVLQHILEASDAAGGKA
jgi:hypothetical protein